MRSRFSLKERDLWWLYEEQKGRCPICDKLLGWDWVVEHNHGDGRVRGLVHHNCNSALACIKESEEGAAAYARYLWQRGTRSNPIPFQWSPIEDDAIVVASKALPENCDITERNWSIREYSLKSRYGITLAQYLSQGNEQGWRCAICTEGPLRMVSSKKDMRKTACVDHNHAYGKGDPLSFRSLLCHDCNLFIGLLEEDAGCTSRIIAYLNRRGSVHSAGSNPLVFPTPTVEQRVGDLKGLALAKELLAHKLPMQRDSCADKRQRLLEHLLQEGGCNCEAPRTREEHVRQLKGQDLNVHMRAHGLRLSTGKKGQQDRSVAGKRSRLLKHLQQGCECSSAEVKMVL